MCYSCCCSSLDGSGWLRWQSKQLAAKRRDLAIAFAMQCVGQEIPGVRNCANLCSNVDSLYR